MRWFFQKQAEAIPQEIWARPEKLRKPKRFRFGGFDAFVEDRHGSACLYVTEAGGDEPLCTVPLMHDPRYPGYSIVLTAGPDNLLGVRIDGRPVVMIDPKRRLVMSRLGGAFGSSAWGMDVYRPWDRALESALFDA